MFGGRLMDLFLDKLSNRLTAQEIIKANAEAEASQLHKAEEQVAEYDAALAQMKQVNAKTQATLVQMEKALAEGLSKFENATLPTEEIEKLVEESLTQIRALSEENAQVGEKIEEGFTKQNAEITDFVHKECVKVYRNIQAVQEAESAKVEENIQKEVAKVLAKQRANLGVGVTTLIFSIAACVGVVFELLVIFGIITF